ncbi:MFS transporter [Georgenia sp. TF02-10]|uniref:MFS transporter n=1 Tax=Georgenia sp. TF02-10 TaxID=2917725 RepID=UPI001FA7E063|nr:MFS transporter [Georgenia sp. TF02-10]UNX53462.1 MFS transporter [Georgenia sp. TF02-10]
MSSGSLSFPSRHDFRLLLLGQAASQLGTQVSGVAIPLLAVLTLQASPLEVGVLSASGAAAFALVGLPAGAWLDRFRRRPILVASDLVRAVLLATVPVAAATDVLTVSHLVIVSLLTGVARVFFDVGYQSYLPSVIGTDRVLAGNSAVETVRATGQVVGPGLGGWLVTLVGAANVVLVQALTFVVSAASLLAIRAGEPRPAPAGRPRLRREIGEGLAFVARTRVLRAMALTSAACNFSFALASAVTFIFLSRTLGLPATAVGAVVAAGSVTVLLGAALTSRLAARVGTARIVWLALVITGPGTLLTPLAQPGSGWWVALLVLGLGAGELGQIVYAVTSVSLRQRLCPPRLLGRVSATVRFVIMGSFPLGALLGGVLGELVGVRATLWVCGILVVLAPLPVWTALRHHRDVEDLPRWTTGEG